MYVIAVALGAVGTAAAAASLTVEGRFERLTDAESMEMLGGAVCFYPSEQSSKLLPRPASDLRLPWFCFTNTRQAMRLLAVPPSASKGIACGHRGNATLRVADYVVYRLEGSGFDTARLLAVHRKSAVEPIPCD